jgi:hypothetical protein
MFVVRGLPARTALTRAPLVRAVPAAAEPVRTVRARTVLGTAVLLAATVLVAACGTATGGAHPAAPMPGMTGMGDMSGMAGMGDMPGMSPVPAAAPPAEAAPTGNGLSGAVGGYALAAATTTVRAGGTFAFHIRGPGGRAVTRYQPYDGELLLFDLIRSDLTGYRHLATAMRQDGTWNVTLPALSPGSYRAYVTFAAPDSSAGKPLVYVLSSPFTVPGGGGTDAALPSPASTAVTDGYTLTLSGRPTAGARTPLDIGFTKGGRPVGYFQRYLDGYAHVTAFHAGDLAFAHLGPAAKDSARGTSTLVSQALFPARGTWRVFVTFQTDGPPRTAVFTVDVP